MCAFINISITSNHLHRVMIRPVCVCVECGKYKDKIYKKSPKQIFSLQLQDKLVNYVTFKLYSTYIYLFYLAQICTFAHTSLPLLHHSIHLQGKGGYLLLNIFYQAVLHILALNLLVWGLLALNLLVWGLLALNLLVWGLLALNLLVWGLMPLNLLVWGLCEILLFFVPISLLASSFCLFLDYDFVFFYIHLILLMCI